MGAFDKVAELTAAHRARSLGRVRRRLAGGAALALLLAACGGGGAEPTAPPPAEARWVVLGSSTAAGVGATLGQSWVSRLAEALRPRSLRIDNRARSGATTYQALPAGSARPAGRPATDPAQDAAQALATRPAVLVLAFPSNDAMAGFTAAETTANLLLIRDLARQQGAAVIVLSSQPRDDAGSAAREAMRSADATLAAALGACFVDVREALSGPGSGIAAAYSAGDGVHLNDVGHALVFERLRSTLEGGRCFSLPAAS